METVEAEVDKHDQMILQLEKQLHDAHHTLVRNAINILYWQLFDNFLELICTSYIRLVTLL